MIIKLIEGADRFLGAPKNWDPLKDGHCGVLPVKTMAFEDNGQPFMVSAWEPTPMELEKLVQGAAVYLRVLGLQHPPVMLFVGDPPDRVKITEVMEQLRTAFEALTITPESPAMKRFVIDEAKKLYELLGGAPIPSAQALLRQLYHSEPESDTKPPGGDEP